ncbi:MAG TPA: carboxypeptidase regulatory-like domain-containing protein [Candidatus Polarisedimenticolaceae bacterium]|nr:carboxypeptidase regulatory-like domain-containing protein [Candidatus Polarisedimenticolaceae bacterium]
MKLRALFATLAVAALTVTVASAQATGGLKIRVIDNADKSPVIGAAVTLSNTNKYVATTSVITKPDGSAIFPVLRVGSGYVIQVIMDGYAGVRQDLEVQNGQMKEFVIALVPEHVEKVTVIGEKQTIDLDNNENSTKFSSDFIADLPVAGRFYQNVIALAPGVQDPNGDGNPNVNGARDRDFKTSVGGVSNVDPLTGQFLNQINSDSIEDLTVITSGAGAEFGRAQGGFATIIQKQGSNDFEGIFGMIYSSKKLDGSGSTGISNSQFPDFYRYDPSLQVSGPIVRDKLWYRLSEELVKREDPVILGTGGSVATTGTTRVSTDNQLTWQVSNRNKLAFTFRADPLQQTNFGVSLLVPVESSVDRKFGGPTYTLTWTAPYSPSLLIDSTVAFQDTHLDLTPTAAGVPNNCHTPAYLGNAQCFDFSSGNFSGSSNQEWHDSRQRLTVRSDATYFKGRMWGMNHQFKFGFVVENERYFKNLVRTPNFTTFVGSDPNNPGHIGTYYTVAASVDPSSDQTATGTNWGVYGEDVIRPISNLSITLGVRIEQENLHAQGYEPFDPQAESTAFLAATAGLTNPDQASVPMQNAFVAYEDIQGSLNAIAGQFPGADFQFGAYTTQLAFWKKFRRPADMNINNTNIAPRLSIAWDPWNDGKSKFSASGGRYYNNIPLIIPTAESEPVIVTFDAFAPAGGGSTGTTAITYVPTFSFSTVDRNIKTPYQDEYSIGFERNLWQESTIKVSYIHRSFKKQLQDIDINQIPGDYGRCLVPLGTGQPTLAPSPGTGPIIDPYTGQTYQDTDPGIGDGRLDDCTGQNVQATVPNSDGGNGHGTATVERPDGVPDLYVLNPGWGSIFQIGNYNHSQYDGLILEFVRRQYKNWQMEASYTLSKATGNGEDFNQALGDDRSTLDAEQGYQSFDVRHSVKFNATTVTPWGFRLGGAVQWQSGLPYSILIRRISSTTALPIYLSPFGQQYTRVRIAYPTHHRNDQRNQGYWNFDTKFVKEMNLGKGMNLQLTAEIFNLFGENTYRIYNDFTNSGQQLNGTNDGTRAFGRQYQIGMRLAF